MPIAAHVADIDRRSTCASAASCVPPHRSCQGCADPRACVDEQRVAVNNLVRSLTGAPARELQVDFNTRSSGDEALARIFRELGWLLNS